VYAYAAYFVVFPRCSPMCLSIDNGAPRMNISFPEGVHTERRRKPRISTRFPITVRGVNANGKGYEFKTWIDNLSASGVYIQLGESIDPYSHLHLCIQLSESETLPGPVIEAEGIVLRTEPRANGLLGLAIVFTRHRFSRSKIAVVPEKQTQV
jgi:hypothetical protein